MKPNITNHNSKNKTQINTLNINNPNNMKNIISLTNNNNTTKNLRSSLNFKNEYNTDSTNIKNSNQRLFNEKNLGYITGPSAHSRNFRKDGKLKIPYLIF